MISRTESEASFILVPEADSQGGSQILQPEVPTAELASSEQSAAPSSSEQAASPPELSSSSEPFAHNWSRSATGGKIYLHGRHFVDGYGRVCNLRGVNVSGNAKTPTNHSHDSFPAEHAAVTFVNRPFPLEEAPAHFARLRRWGLTFIRFLVTWEAIEHSGPGAYDTDYLAYLRALLSLLPQYGLAAFVVMHQDVWSRYSGGSGAPAWTLEAVGFDLANLEGVHAAWLRGVKGGGHIEEERGLWPCGYQKLAAATMATCFWGGGTFAPKLRLRDVRGAEVSVQEFLQGAFIGAWEQLVRAVGDLEGVLGFEMMNEPHRGYIELQSMYAFDYNTDLHLGHVPTALQSFMLGAGIPTEVAFWVRTWPWPTRYAGMKLLNAEEQRAWREDGPTEGKCLWEMHHVWGFDRANKEGVVLRENYFTKNPQTNKPIEFYTDFYLPFIGRWADAVHSLAPEKMIFLEPIPNEFCPEIWKRDKLPKNLVYAPHWYELKTLFSKEYKDFNVDVQGLSRGMFPLKAFFWGHQGARDNFTRQIRNIVESGYRELGEIPQCIGELGLPMDINQRQAFRTDDWKWQARMMDAMMTALERCLVGFTLWNYNPDNDDHLGDDWNGENFSWFSQRRAAPQPDLSQGSADLDQGGRILRSVVRPYAAKTAGIPLRSEYDLNSGRFEFEWTTPKYGAPESSSSVAAPPRAGHPELRVAETEIFVPSMTAHGRKVVVSGLTPQDAYAYDEARQTLTIVTRDNAPGAVHRICVALDPPLRPYFKVNTFWGDFGGYAVASGVLLAAALAYAIV